MASREYLDTVRDLVDSYKHSPETLEFMRELDLVTVSGPAGSGKNTVMTATGLETIIGHTTRTRRSETESDYHFIETAEDEERLLEDLRMGNMVQVAVHPKTGDFYGGDRSDYELHGVGLLDVMPLHYYKLLDENNFASIRATALTAPDYATWQARFLGRSEIDFDEYAKRMSEAHHSLEITVPDPAYYYIMNDTTELAANALRKFALGEPINQYANNLARGAARNILQELKMHPTLAVVEAQTLLAADQPVG